MKNFFYLDESPVYKGKNVIRINENRINFEGARASRNVLFARLMNLSWGDFLRMCRDYYGASVYGKNSLYPVPYFPIGGSGADELCNELNKRMKELQKLGLDFFKDEGEN